MANTRYYDHNAPAGAALILFHKQGFLGAYPLGLLTTVGRVCRQSSCDILLPSPIVSRSHGEIACTDGTYFYRDLGSTNGTYLNGKLLGKGQPESTAFLHDGDILSFDIPKEGVSHPEMVFALFATHCHPASLWGSIPLTTEIAEIAIGRNPDAGLQLPQDTVSEKHASFFCAGQGWAIIDHGSTNGVYLNGKRLSAPRYLSGMDTVRIADAYFIFTGDRLLCSKGLLTQSAPEAPAPAVEAAPSRPVKDTGELKIHIVHRSVFQRFKRLTLLQDIRLRVSAGEMVLILGGSGAGKTTFINAVMGYEKAAGTILYRDTDIYAEYEKMKYEIGFVPQQDLLRGSDTVYDTLSNAAEMKLPRKVSFEDRQERINQVLEQLGLSRERDTLVSKLSGGQRKRLSIAVEFIADPGLFFLDEPDSGLDDIMGRGLMESLRGIADKGKIVMLITHSPERAADLFDKVIVLAKSTRDNCGHLAFYGSVEEAFRFFEVDAFRSIVKKLNRPDENGEGLSDYYIDKFAATDRG